MGYTQLLRRASKYLQFFRTLELVVFYLYQSSLIISDFFAAGFYSLLILVFAGNALWIHILPLGYWYGYFPLFYRYRLPNYLAIGPFF